MPAALWMYYATVIPQFNTAQIKWVLCKTFHFPKVCYCFKVFMSRVALTLPVETINHYWDCFQSLSKLRSKINQMWKFRAMQGHQTRWNTRNTEIEDWENLHLILQLIKYSAVNVIPLYLPYSISDAVGSRWGCDCFCCEAHGRGCPNVQLALWDQGWHFDGYNIPFHHLHRKCSEHLGRQMVSFDIVSK